MNKRPRARARAVQRLSLGSMEGSQWVLPVKECVLQKIQISTPLNTMNAEERCLKHPLIVTAMAVLVYARPTPRDWYVYP